VDVGLIEWRARRVISNPCPRFEARLRHLIRAHGVSFHDATFQIVVWSSNDEGAWARVFGDLPVPAWLAFWDAWNDRERSTPGKLSDN
jgi:hypothetical protein